MLTRRFYREYKNLDELDPASLGNPQAAAQALHAGGDARDRLQDHARREVHHTIQLDGAGAADYRSVIAFFARQLLKDLRLVGGYDVLYPKVESLHARASVRTRRSTSKTR